MIASHEAEVAARFDRLQARFKATVAPDDYRLRAIVDFLRPGRGMTILDLGCGKGRFARELGRLGARVVGVDLSAGMLREAAGMERVRAPAHRLPLAAGAFDAAIAVEVFEHFDPRTLPAVLAELRRVLRPGGTLAILDKNLGALDAGRPWLPSVLVKRIDEHRGRWMYPAGGPVRERWFRPSRLRAELRGRFDDVRVVHLMSPAEEGSRVFRVVPATRLMTMWSARARGGGHV